MARPRLTPGSFGEISVRRTPDGKQWKARVRYRDPLGEYGTTSAVAATKGSALDRVTEKAERLTATPRAETVTVTTIGELCRTWFQRVEAESGAFWSRPDAAERLGAKPPRPQSLVHSRRAIRYICDPENGIGDTPIGEATTFMLETWLDGHTLVARGRAAEIRIALRLAFRSAVRLGLLATDPMAGVSPIRRNNPRPIALSTDELRTLRKTLHESPRLAVTVATVKRLDALLVLLLGAALRVGEAAALQWGDMELNGDDPTVTVRSTRVEIAGRGTYRQDAPKTESSRRTVILPRYVVESLRGIQPSDASPADWVFPTRAGNCWNSGNANKVLKMVVASTNGALAPHRVTFHKLRSTAASAIAEAFDDHVAALVLGHAPVGVTQRHYIARSAVVPDVREVLQGLLEASHPFPRPAQEVPVEAKPKLARKHLRLV